METSVDNSQNPPRRRSAHEIIDAIYGALPVQDFDPIAHIAEKADLDWKTTKRYLELILHIQQKQKGDWLLEMDVGENTAYARRKK